MAPPLFWHSPDLSCPRKRPPLYATEIPPSVLPDISPSRGEIECGRRLTQIDPVCLVEPAFMMQ